LFQIYKRARERERERDRTVQKGIKIIIIKKREEGEIYKQCVHLMQNFRYIYDSGKGGKGCFGGAVKGGEPLPCPPEEDAIDE
jgi:hypothetical protein